MRAGDGKATTGKKSEADEAVDEAIVELRRLEKEDSQPIVRTRDY
jgi:hypothetical protein